MSACVCLAACICLLLSVCLRGVRCLCVHVRLSVCRMSCCPSLRVAILRPPLPLQLPASARLSVPLEVLCRSSLCYRLSVLALGSSSPPLCRCLWPSPLRNRLSVCSSVSVCPTVSAVSLHPQCHLNPPASGPLHLQVEGLPPCCSAGAPAGSECLDSIVPRERPPLPERLTLLPRHQKMIKVWGL